MPFTQEQFFEVFRNYNLAVWPMQIVMYALGAISIWFAFWKFKGSDRTVSAILGFFWLWMGIAYFAVYNTSIYAGAWVYGLFFVIQGIVFLVSGSFQHNLVFGFRNTVTWWLGTVFVAYAAIVYPFLGAAAGHAWPSVALFGVAPDPTTIFAFGIVMWTVSRFSNWVMVIPFIWSLIGSYMAMYLGRPEDTGLIIAGVVGGAFLLVRNLQMPVVEHKHAIGGATQPVEAQER
jgi:hypothetical protein